jgi:hypothetical protein
MRSVPSREESTSPREQPGIRIPGGLLRSWEGEVSSEALVSSPGYRVDALKIIEQSQFLDTVYPYIRHLLLSITLATPGCLCVLCMKSRNGVRKWLPENE